MFSRASPMELTREQHLLKNQYPQLLDIAIRHFRQKFLCWTIFMINLAVIFIKKITNHFWKVKLNPPVKPKIKPKIGLLPSDRVENKLLRRPKKIIIFYVFELFIYFYSLILHMLIWNDLFILKLVLAIFWIFVLLYL